MPSPVEREQLRLVAADVMFGQLHEEEVVDLASRLVANDIGGSATVELAAQPARLAQLRYDELELLVRAMLAELEIELPRSAVDRPPTVQDVLVVLESLMVGIVDRESVARWARTWYIEREREVDDEVVWEGLSCLVLVDSPTTDREYLYGDEDFSAWHDELRNR